MKKASSIPITKIQRASKLFSTGAKVGVNYLKYYGDKITKTEEDAREKLNKNNAEDIYDSLKDLKGSPFADDLNSFFSKNENPIRVFNFGNGTFV